MNILSFLSFFLLLAGSNSRGNEPGKIIRVSSAIQLQQALENAKPGDEIVMKEGLYNGYFTIPETASGTAAKPVILRGSSNVILDGNTTGTGYVLHLQANYWVIKGFTITNGLKGLICDAASHNVIDSLTVYNIGEEAIHFRRFSAHNILQHCNISKTGIKTADYGEGIYIGTAVSNWVKYTNGEPDRSDSNTIINNRIGPGVAAECIDVKEGSAGGIIRGNSFNSAGITGANSADSWMDVKGNGYLIEDNTGLNPAGSILKDGYQVHCAVAGWGNDNVFKNNNSGVNAAGYGFNIVLVSSKGKTSGNKVYKNNKVTGAAKGVANIGLSE